MNSREKLNAIFAGGAILVALLLGVTTGSFGIFVIAMVGLFVALLNQGMVRLGKKTSLTQLKPSRPCVTVPASAGIVTLFF